MSLRVVTRPDSGTLQITGRLTLPDGRQIRIRQSPTVPGDLKLAREEAAAIQAKLLRDAWHGERRGTRSFEDAVLSYFEASPRAQRDIEQLQKILSALGPNVPLSEINQQTIATLKPKVLRPNPKSSTLARQLIVPISAIMHHAHKLGWCDMPYFVTPKQPEGRISFVFPEEAKRLIEAAAPHAKPLFTFLLGTGARASEATKLEWRDVDLVGATATFWKTKNGRRRIAMLPPVVIEALRCLADSCEPKVGGRPVGRVFRWWTATTKLDQRTPKMSSYSDSNEGKRGGQFKSAFQSAARRARLVADDRKLKVHDLRHTWATWHYAVYKDLLKLKAEGGWRTLNMVERYAHLMPAGYQAEILSFMAGHTVDTARGHKEVSTRK